MMQLSHLPHAVAASFLSRQLIVLAIILAVVVLPTPRIPVRM